MQNGRTRFIRILTDIFYLAVIVYICYICYDLFSMMAVSDKHDGYWSDLPYYIKTANEFPDRNHRLVLVLFRFLYGIKGLRAIETFLAVEIGLIFIANLLFIKSYSHCDMKRPGYRALVEFLSIAVVFSGPIYVPHFHELFYKDTLPIFAWHSPTQQMTTLFGVLGTMFLFLMLEEYEKTVSAKWWIGSAICFFMSAYAKPSYIINIVPAVVIVFLIDLFRKSSLDLKTKFKRLFVIGLSLVPSGIYMLVLNYIIYQRAESQGNGDIIMDSTKLSGPMHVVVIVCCCVAFPLVVMLFNLPKLLKDKRYQIVTLSAIVGMLQWGLLSESGRRASHGNFTWGTTIGGYMLWIVSMSIAVDNLKDKNFLGGVKWLRVIYFLMLAGSLGLALISQVYYFITLYNGAGFWR